MRASPTSQGEPRIVMACEAEGPTCEDTATFAWEKSWIWHRPIPAQPMMWPATVSGTARATVMRSSFTEGMELIACWGRHVDAGVGRGFLQRQEGLVRGVVEGPGVVAGPGVEEGAHPKKRATSEGASWMA